MGLRRPISAAALFATPELQVQYPGEVELRREGFDEGVGHGFDNHDRNPSVSRSIATPDPAATVVEWFTQAFEALGWNRHGMRQGNRCLRHEDSEHIFIRIDRDQGRSRVASLIKDARFSAMQDEFEKAWYHSMQSSDSVLTIFYGVAVADGQAPEPHE